MNSRILPLLALVLSIVTFFGYVNPIYTGDIAEKRSAIESNNNALSAANDFRQHASQLASEEAQINQNSRSRLNILLPDSVNNVRAILDLEALAVRSGISISAINVSKQDDESQNPNDGIDTIGPVGSVGLTLSASGTYESLKTFLRGIESSQRLLDVTQLGISGSETGVYTYQLNARLYWLR